MHLKELTRIHTRKAFMCTGVALICFVLVALILMLFRTKEDAPVVDVCRSASHIRCASEHGAGGGLLVSEALRTGRPVCTAAHLTFTDATGTVRASSLSLACLSGHHPGALWPPEALTVGG